MYAYRAPDESLLDGRYLVKLERFLRAVPGHGDAFTAVGQPMIFADMVRMVVHDGVIVTIVAMIGVLALLVFAFRSRVGVGMVLASVVFGTLWMIGYAALFDIKLNFLNFVVIPITLGIGVDYGANLFSRYRQEGPGRIADAFVNTGPAVVLSSATTIFGYATLLYSSNLALQSFGNLAVFGEFTCLGAAELVMISMIVRREKIRGIHR
jgi:predicted RND superfamily exporter protein